METSTVPNRRHNWAILCAGLNKDDRHAMIEITQYKGQKVAVVGLGRSGMAAAHALQAGGAEVLAWDDNAEARARAEKAGFSTADPAQVDWSAIAALVLSPGIPLTHPQPHPAARLAQEAGCPVIGDIELLYRAVPEATTIAITGTNGKSTTTALTGHILETAGLEVAVGGNLGLPVLELPKLDKDGIYVLELSSYQLDLLQDAAFDIAVLLNITPDHLDRHGDMDGYVAVKASLFDRLKGPKISICGIDDEPSRMICESLVREDQPSPIAVSGTTPVASGVYVVDGMLKEWPDRGRTSIDLTTISTLPGTHNHQNAAAAYAATHAAGVSLEVIEQGFRSFPGLAHRQELVATIGDVSFVNDSKATNPEAAARALSCYGNIYWIAGGRGKEGGLEALTPYLGNIRHAFLIGEAAGLLAEKLGDKVPVTQSGTLEAAFDAARQQASQEGLPGAAVLLSPACASFDQFRDFEARGGAFRALVNSLKR